jgi:thiamine biosynthesis lipoprotein
MKARAILPAVVIVLLSVTGCGRDEVRSYSRPLLGTIVNLSLIGSREKTDAAAEAAFNEIERIEKLMSPYRKGSDIFRLNDAVSARNLELNPETVELVARSLEISRKSGGAFDVTYAALGEIWDYKKRPFVPPTRKEVKKALERTGYGKLRVDSGNSTLSFKVPGMKLGLGGIAKGYAVARAVGVLKEKGIRAGIVEEGGDLQVFGTKFGKPWKTGIIHPREKGLAAAVKMKDGQAIATSGDYERYAEHGGKRYSHIIDPRTGYPAESDLVSVSVITGDPVRADAWATAIMVLGLEGYRDLSVKPKDLQVICIDRDLNMYVSRSLRPVFSLLDDELSVKWIDCRRDR